MLSYIKAATIASIITLVITKSNWNTWPPYTIKYPRPPLETRNSPEITPTNESPIFKSPLDRNQVLSNYKRGHVLSKTENTVYTTINEMGEESQQKTLRKI